MNVVSVPIRLRGGSNAREHHMARAQRVSRERWAVKVGLHAATRPQIREKLIVRLTRIGLGTRPMDSDNLAAALKSVRDQFAEWVGVDDGREKLVEYRCAQERGPWGCRIEWAYSSEWPPEVAT